MLQVFISIHPHSIVGMSKQESVSIRNIFSIKVFHIPNILRIKYEKLNKQLKTITIVVNFEDDLCMGIF